MDLAKAPKRIKNDGLKDVIVKISFKPELSRVALEQKIESGLSSSGFNYVKYSMSEAKNYKDDHKKVFLAVDEYKLMIEEESVLFNIVDKYPGWNNYHTFIDRVMGFIPQLHFSGVSINYISSFDNLRIFDYLDKGMDLCAISGCMGSELKYSFVEKDKDGRTAFVDVLLVNNKIIPRIQLDPVSCINIKVQCSAQIEWSGETMLKFLSFIHAIEWKVFIEAFKRSFFEKRGAVYE